MYTVTDKKLTSELAKMNKRFFDNALEVDVLEVDDLDTEWGFCVDDEEWVLGVTREFPTKKEFHETLLHEMAHLLQINADLPVDHGEVFEDMCEMFKENGFDVE